MQRISLFNELEDEDMAEYIGTTIELETKPVCNEKDEVGRVKDK